MATINIYVSRVGNSSNIKLQDSEGHNPGNDNITTTVNTGDVLVWQLDQNSGLASLDGVRMKSDSQNNLLVNIIPSGTNQFTATVVGTSPGVGKFETYQIGYKVPGNGTIIWDDPKLQMNN
ncbi:MAG: hypothetical protein WD512_19425 [Candidatus Paceibacterota bacterium]